MFPCLSCSSMPADMTMLADHTARQLLDFSQKLDINLLDNVVNSMYYDVGSQVWVCLQNPRQFWSFETHSEFGAVQYIKNGFRYGYFSKDLHKKFSPTWRTTQMPGPEWTPYWSSRRTWRQKYVNVNVFLHFAKQILVLWVLLLNVTLGCFHTVNFGAHPGSIDFKI